MPSKKELDDTYMGTAILHSKMSKALRTQVGACLVTENGVCLTGYNGTPAGLDNRCENTVWNTDASGWLMPELVTKPEVIHAELNCILKAAREGVSCKDATVYVTLSPCVPCSAMMINVGIRRLVFKEEYRDLAGVDLLLKAGIKVEKVP